MCDRPPGLSAAEVRGAGRRIKFPRPMNDDVSRRGSSPESLSVRNTSRKGRNSTYSASGIVHATDNIRPASVRPAEQYRPSLSINSKSDQRDRCSATARTPRAPPCARPGAFSARHPNRNSIRMATARYSIATHISSGLATARFTGGAAFARSHTSLHRAVWLQSCWATCVIQPRPSPAGEPSPSASPSRQVFGSGRASRDPAPPLTARRLY
jgi:hypothetical protein